MHKNMKGRCQVKIAVMEKSCAFRFKDKQLGSTLEQLQWTRKITLRAEKVNKRLFICCLVFQLYRLHGLVGRDAELNTLT